MNHQTIASIRADDLKLVAAMCGEYRRFTSGRSPLMDGDGQWRITKTCWTDPGCACREGAALLG